MCSRLKNHMGYIFYLHRIIFWSIRTLPFFKSLFNSIFYNRNYLDENKELILYNYL
jgi:hypothetical protein